MVNDQSILWSLDLQYLRFFNNQITFFGITVTMQYVVHVVNEFVPTYVAIKRIGWTPKYCTYSIGVIFNVF